MPPPRRVGEAKEWLETRLRTWVSQARGQARGEPDASGLDVVKLHEEGRYREAELAARRLVESLRDTRGDRHPHYATALSNLALSLQKQGDLAGAEPLLRQAMEIRQETLGDRHPHYATALNNLALLLCERGDLAGAEPLMRQGLDIRREALGERHPDQATGLTSLAMLLCERGDLAGAEPLLRQALEIRRETLGDRHPHYATALNNLALLLRERGDLAGAEPLLRQALEIRRETLGEQHPDTRACVGAVESVRRPGGEPKSAAATPRPAPAVRPVPVAPTSSPVPPPPPTEGAGQRRDVATLRGDWEALADRFVRVSGQMGTAVERMRSAGLPPAESVLTEAAACRRDFDGFRAEVFRLAESVGAAELAPREASGLPELLTLLDLVAELDVAHRRHGEVRERATAAAEQVFALACHGGPYEELLAGVRSQVEAVRQAIGATPAQAHGSDAERLAAGEHPLASVAHLARGAEELDDAGWADLFDSVAVAFGRPTAVALARGKLFLPGSTR